MRFPSHMPSWRTFLLAAILLGIFVVELVVPAHRQSQTSDEGYHIFSGYTAWKQQDFGINPEVPPFVKMLAALPVLPLSLHVAEQPPNLPFRLDEYFGAKTFLYSNDADVILFRARMAAAALTLLLAILVFVAACEMFDAAAALLALALLVFEPNIIAHGSLVTTDIASALFLFATVYTFYRYVKRPSTVRLLLVGLMAGLSLASKDSGVLCFPVLLTLAITEVAWPSGHAARETASDRRRRALRLASAILCTGALAVAVLWLSYGFRYQARPACCVLIPSLPQYAAQLDHPWETQTLVALGRWHLLPEAYLFGWADTLNTHGHISSYLFGTVYRQSVWFYFPAVFVVKSTIGFLLLLLILVPIGMWFHGSSLRREMLFLAIPPLIYFPFAMASKFNIGVRHLLPTYPFLILLAAFAACALVRADRRWLAFAAAVVVLHVASSVRAFPNYIAYANEAWGGPARSYKVLSDSNVDWAQQLKETGKYLADRGIKDCWFAYFDQVFVDPGYYHIACKALPTGLSRQNITQVIPEQIDGTILISATELSGEFWGPGSLNPYAQFQQMQPDDVIGGGILVFRGRFNLPLVSALSHEMAAIHFLQAGFLERALTEAQTAVALAPDDANGEAVLGDALMQLQQKEDARKAYSRALVLAKTVYPAFQDSMVPLLEARLGAN